MSVFVLSAMRAQHTNNVLSLIHQELVVDGRSITVIYPHLATATFMAADIADINTMLTSSYGPTKKHMVSTYQYFLFNGVRFKIRYCILYVPVDPAGDFDTPLRLLDNTGFAGSLSMLIDGLDGYVFFGPPNEFMCIGIVQLA